MTYYRIVNGRWASGYELQSWSWWWPFWAPVGGANTWGSVADAEARVPGVVVKYLGRCS